MICKFEELYQQEASGQRARYEALREGFAQQFGSAEGGQYFSAPGRRRLAATIRTTTTAVYLLLQ